MAASHRAGVVSLYRRCLRAAARCPQSVHASTWRTYAMIKFREGRRALRSKTERAAAIADAFEQCERMEYYQRAAGLIVPEAAPAARNSSLSSSSTTAATSVSGQGHAQPRALDIQEWLETLRITPEDAETYASKFVDAGFDDLQAIREDCTEDDLIEAGMKTGHVRRILKATGDGERSAGVAGVEPAPT